MHLAWLALAPRIHLLFAGLTMIPWVVAFAVRCYSGCPPCRSADRVDPHQILDKSAGNSQLEATVLWGVGCQAHIKKCFYSVLRKLKLSYNESVLKMITFNSSGFCLNSVEMHLKWHHLDLYHLHRAMLFWWEFIEFRSVARGAGLARQGIIFVTISLVLLRSQACGRHLCHGCCALSSQLRRPGLETLLICRPQISVGCKVFVFCFDTFDTFDIDFSLSSNVWECLQCDFLTLMFNRGAYSDMDRWDSLQVAAVLGSILETKILERWWNVIQRSVFYTYTYYITSYYL